MCNSSNSTNSFAAIEVFCMRWHGSQTHGGRLYIEHLRDVVNEVRKWQSLIEEDVLDVMIAAAYGHDLLEDTEVSREDVLSLFGPKSFALIDLLTDQPGENRKERKARTLPLIAGNRHAVFLKVCDRLANAGNSAQRYKDMYRNEQAEFKAYLYRVGEYDAMWQELDSILGL